MNTNARAKQLGFSLIETLIALTISSTCILGLVKLHTITNSTTHQAQLASQANILLNDLSERIRSNKEAAKQGKYLFKQTSKTFKDCSQLCTATDIAQFDQHEWINKVKTILPDGGYNISYNNQGYHITLYWHNPLGDHPCISDKNASAYVSCRSKAVPL